MHVRVCLNVYICICMCVFCGDCICARLMMHVCMCVLRL